MEFRIRRSKIYHWTRGERENMEILSITLFLILIMNITISRAQPFHCNRSIRFKDPVATLKSIRSNHFLVIDASNPNMVDDDANEDFIPQLNFPGFKSSYPTTAVEDFDRRRVPRVISQVKLFYTTYFPCLTHYTGNQMCCL